jgi:predicted Zn-dependent peptidase
MAMRRGTVRKRASRKQSSGAPSASQLLAQGALRRGARHQVCRFRLANGLRVITVPQPHLHTATITVFVKVGCRHETAKQNGLSHLLEHMVFRGSAEHPTAYALNVAIEELGGTLHGATHADSTVFEVTLPPQNVRRGIEILAGLFRAPTFADLDVEKRIVREEILEYLDESGREVDPDNLSRQLMFGSHPLGMTITGSLKNLARFSERDLAAHKREYYVASNMALCIAGAVDVAAALRAARSSFGELATGQPSRALCAPAARGKPRFVHVESQGSQSDVRLCFSTFGASDPRYLALELLVRVIDDGMSTRLHRRICEELGLAYEVFATLEPYEEAGVLDVGAAVEHAKVPVFIESALELLNGLAERNVTQAELSKAKHRYAWQLEAILDDAQAMCSHYGQRALIGQDGHLQALRAQIDRIDARALREVAREVFCRERLHVVTVGTLSAHTRERVRQVTGVLRSQPRASTRAHARVRAARAG